MTNLHRSPPLNQSKTDSGIVNESQLLRLGMSGYKVVFVPFVNGHPSGPSRDILSGFLAPDERESYGRPVGVTLGPDGALLVADDVGDVIWRVTGA
jgi:glucose/arabinose dehydrogenase